MDDLGTAPGPRCSSLDNPLLWTKVKALLDNQSVPIHCRALGRWRTFTICTTDDPASSSMMQHFSACLSWACSHVPGMSIITAERCLNSVQVKKGTLRWTHYWLQCHRSSEKEPTKSDKADFRKINIFKNVPWLQSSFWGTTTFTQDVALSKDFMNFHRAHQDPICAVSKFSQQNSPRIKLLSASFIWRKSGATHVGIQVLPTPSCRFLKAHTTTPASLSELRCNFHSTPRAERSSSKLKSIKRDTKIKSSPHTKCKGCCLNHSKPPLQILVLALLVSSGKATRSDFIHTLLAETSVRVHTCLTF